MVAFRTVLLGLAVLALGARAGQLDFTEVTIGDVSREITNGQAPSFIDVKPTGGLNGDAYAVKLAVKNLDKEVAIQDVAIQVYAGAFKDSIPADAQALQINATGVSSCVGVFLERGAQSERL